MNTILYDRALQLEAYRFTGFAQQFPLHFHEHYVIGLIESGTRKLRCGNREYRAVPGDLLLFHPGEPHACRPEGTTVLDYRALNISLPTLRNAVEALTGQQFLPCFSDNVLRDDILARCFQAFHDQILNNRNALENKNCFRQFLAALLPHVLPKEAAISPDCSDRTEAVCAYLESHFSEHISLDQLCRRAGFSKSTLLRAFTQAKGMTPYRYLESVRVNHAKVMLEAGASPAEAALCCGFSDQSHLTGYFSRFSGFTPGIYRNMFQEATTPSDVQR